MSNDPFAAFGATEQTQQSQGNTDPWANMNNQPGVLNGMPQPTLSPDTANQQMQNESDDPWATAAVAAPTQQPPALSMNAQPPAEMSPQPPTHQSPAQYADPFASMNNQTSPSFAQPDAALVMSSHPTAIPSPAPVDPWASINQQPTNVPNVLPPQMHVAEQPMMMQQNMTTVQPQETVPETVICNQEGSPPSPIGDVSVVGAQAAAAASQSSTLYQPVMTKIHEQPQQILPQSMQNVNPFELLPAVQEVQQPNDQPSQEEPQMNTPINPFGEVDLTGQMNNLSMQNQAGMMTTAETQGVMNGMPTAPMVDLTMPPNPMAPPPPSYQPPVPPTELPTPFPQQSSETIQAPLSPVDPFAGYSLSPSAVLSPQVSDPFGYAFSPMASPTEGQKDNAAIPSAVPELPFMNGSDVDPFGTQPQQTLVPSNVTNDDPFGVFDSNNATPAPAVNSSDPFSTSTSDSINANAVIPSNQVVDDPFDIFGTATPTQQPPQQPTTNLTIQDQDPWAAAGFNDVSQTLLSVAGSVEEDSEVPIELDTNNLPKQGDYYEARINAPSLGVMFYTARDLENTLLYNMPTNVIDSFKSRPIVAYVAENSAAYNSGVHLGHCILSVNGTEISNPDECADVIRHASRPMNIRAYVMPELEVTLAEGKHMVKYDNRAMEAPSSTIEWKEKYVVVGGIVAKPWLMNMYRSKAEYDIAVKETHNNYSCSVKVKQFDLRGARMILRGKDGKPDIVKYHASIWHYITILPAKGYPIKISSESLDELEPVYRAVRRFIRKDMENRNLGYDWK